jgi:general secretion pathway protein M
MKDWFDTLDPREQVFVLAGGVIVACALLFTLVWTPLNKSNANLKADIAIWQQALADLKPLTARANASDQNGTNTAVTTTQSPLIIVNRTLQKRGIDRYLQRSQPTTSNGIRVEFENVAFDELMLWLGDLGEQYAMHVQAASFARGSQSNAGRINATLTLERVL